MLCVIDSRERDLIPIIQDKKENIEISIKQLDLGDIIIRSGDEDRIIIERKTLADLVSSIKDGRYKEQMARLNAYDIPNHNVYYLIEGKMETNIWKKQSDSNKHLIHSAIISISHYHGFSVMRTDNINESVQFIICMNKKIQNHAQKREPYFKKEVAVVSQTMSNSQPDYCNTIQKQKSANITPDNIGRIMLQQIPGVSSAVSESVFNVYLSIDKLILAIRQNRNCLDCLTIKTTSGKTQKMNRSTILKIVNYLCPISNDIVENNTSDTASIPIIDSVGDKDVKI